METKTETITQRTTLSYDGLLSTLQTINPRVFSVTLEGFKITLDEPNSNTKEGKYLFIIKDRETNRNRGHAVLILP